MPSSQWSPDISDDNHRCNHQSLHNPSFLDKKWSPDTGWGPQDNVQLPYKWLNLRVYGRCNELVNGCFHGLYKPTFTSLGGDTIQISPGCPTFPCAAPRPLAPGPSASCRLGRLCLGGPKSRGVTSAPKNMRKTLGKWWFNQFKPEKLWLKHQTRWFHWRNICIQVSKHGRFDDLTSWNRAQSNTWDLIGCKQDGHLKQPGTLEFFYGDATNKSGGMKPKPVKIWRYNYL